MRTTSSCWHAAVLCSLGRPVNLNRCSGARICAIPRSKISERWNNFCSMCPHTRIMASGSMPLPCSYKSNPTLHTCAELKLVLTFCLGRSSLPRHPRIDRRSNLLHQQNHIVCRHISCRSRIGGSVPKCTERGLVPQHARKPVHIYPGGQHCG